MNQGKWRPNSAGNLRRLICLLILVVFVFTSVFPPLWAGADPEALPPPDAESSLFQQSEEEDPPVTPLPDGPAMELLPQPEEKDHPAAPLSDGPAMELLSGSEGDYAVTNLSAASNAENDAIVLTWENPAENFNYAFVERWRDSGEGGGRWSSIGDTEGNTYTDTNVIPYRTYRYRVTAVDNDWSEEQVPVEVTGALAVTDPILFSRWDANNGRVNAGNVHYFYVTACFMAAEDIVSIAYEISADETKWDSIPEEIIGYDGGLYYSSWDGEWSRSLELDLSGYEEGPLWLRVLAEDSDGHTTTETLALSIDLACEAATDYRTVPNAENTAIELSWSAPEDFDYAEIYKEYYYYGWKWGYEARVTGTSYTDGEVDTANPYATYRYKIVLYDKHGNESPETPVFTGSLAAPGPIGLKAFDTDSRDCRINRYSSSGYYLSASFYSVKPLTEIRYEYSLDGTGWLDLKPFISEDQKLQREERYFYSYRFVRMNIGPDSGIPDGPISVRATAADEDDNTLTAQVDLIKDATPPQSVTNIVAVPNGDNTAIVLSWSNPAEDFAYVHIYRDSTELTPEGFNAETFTDATLKTGVQYRYRFDVYDAFGNLSASRPEIEAILSTSVPVLEEMSPGEGYLTNGNTVGYSATFRSDIPVSLICFEASKDGGVTWITLKEGTPEKEYSGYRLYGSWDVGGISEETWLLRATATDANGGSASETRTVHIDHVGPPATENFTGKITPGSSNVMEFRWDPVPGAKQYILTKKYANPQDGNYNPSYSINAPETSYELDYDIRTETPYIFILQAIDAAGNYGAEASIALEIYSGPDIVLDGGHNVYTNQNGYVLKGSVTPPDSSVTVEDAPVTVDAAGRFSYETTLTSGNNDFTVIAEKDGQTHRTGQRVTYDTALPTISGTFPSNGALVQGKRSRIYLDAYDSGGSLARKVLQVTRDEGATWLDVIEIPLNKTEIYWDTTSPVGETGVLADGPYKFRFSVWDSAGNNRVSSVMVWTVDNTRPEPPADLTAVAETGKITLNWPASVSGDLRTSSPYTIYRSMKPGGGYTSLATTNNTNYTDTTAEGGKTYYYVVTATDKAGNESAYSKEAADQITADVTAPVFLSVPAEGSTYGNTYPSTGGTGTSFTQYLSATDDSPQGVKQFKVEYSNDGGATWKAFTSGASSGTSGGTKYYYTTFYINTAGMTHGPYLFRYSATDYSGNTVVSPVKNMTVDLTAHPVRNLSARPGEASAILEWELPETAEPSVYQIWRSTYYSGGYNRIGDSLASTTQSYTDSGVSIGTTYYYKVITLDNYGNTAASPIASTVPTDDLTPPEIIQVNTEDGALIGGKSVSLSLDARDNKEPTQILFSGSQDGGATWQPLQVSFTGRYLKPDNITYSFGYNWNPAGLTSGEIQVRMTAKDAAGNSSVTVTRTWTLDLTVTPPANLRATGGDGSILIEWDGINDTDLGTYVYTVLRAEKTGGPYTVLESLLPKDRTSYTDNNAATGVTYYYVVRSRDILGNEAQSEELAATPAGDEIPPFIDSVVPASGATMGGDASRELRVYATDNAGWIGTTAAFAYSADGGTGWLPVNTVYDGPTNYDGTKFYFRCYWDLGGLPTGEYKVRYTVTDSSGNSTSQIVDYFVDRTPPSPPKNLLANYGSLNIGLGWEIPPEADVTGYRVYRSNSMHDSYVKIGDVAGKESNSFADNTVVSGVLYYYRVTAIDAFLQEGEPSNIASAKAEADHIPPEVILMEPDYYTVVGAVVKITVRAEDNSALSSISLEYYNAATESWVPINTIATLDTAVFNWSTAGLSGEIRVRAIAKDSAGNFSSPEDGKAIKIYIIDNIGPAVTGLKGTSFGGDIVLEWDNVTDKDFDYFLVEKQDENGTYREVRKVYNVLGLNVTGLTPNTDYRFRVTAFDKAGNPGEPAEITVNSGGDTLPPVVDFQAQWYQIYYGNQSILIDAFEARDNVGVKKIIAQYSADGTTWVDIGDRTLDTPVAKLRTGELWDVSALPDGVYDVRIIVEDEAGNRSQPSEPAYYFVDHLAPAAPTDLELSSTAGYINLSWKYEAERDFWYFRLWRAETEEGPFEPLLLGKYQYLRYLDRNVENGKTYYYKVTVVDRAGNESAYSAVISGGLSPDTNPPYLYLYDPIDGNVLSLKTRFNVNVWDDLALKSLAIRYRAAGTAGEWGEVFHKDYDPNGMAAVTSREETFFWDTKDLPEGRYDIHYIVTDKAGNVTDALVMTHLMNNIPPDTPTLSGAPGGWSASLSWTCGPEPEDFSRYTVYKTDQLGGNFRNIGSTGEKAFADPDVRPGIRYYYYVRAYDVYGNYSQSNTINLVPTNEDLLAPLAKAGDDLVLTIGLEGYFDGTLSSDNDRIAAYSWDFGDGGVSSVAQPVHAYTDSGSYTVTLTVRDPAGNTGSDAVSVTVVSPDEVGILEVKVINDATGELLPGASVVIDYPDGASLKATTNSVGAAFVVAPPGAYQVYAFKTDFKPASQRVVMERGTRNTIMIRLPKGPVVTGELKAERMTLDQIIAAGIDISDPENRQAYQFEIGLGFMDQPVIMTQNRFLPPPMAPANFTINEDGTRIFIFEPEREDGSGGRIFIGEKLDLGGGGPAMAYMIIPGKTAWLKEFFDIGLTIQNGADPEYIIEGAYAKLTLPDGLSLAPTREGQHLYMEMGDIPGGETGFANWIIRGDQKGEYRLEAEFSGTIMPFGDVIRQFFRNEEPIRVWAGNALKMHVQAQDRADKGYPYNLRVGIENASDIPLYHVDFELLEETKVNYIYTPNQKLSETIEEMAAGTTIWKDFQLIPAVDGDLNLGNSFILRTGGEADIETDTISVSVPENAVGTAPVLTQANNANGTADLSWDAVDGAEGYKIYRVRQDLNMSVEPEDLVYTCGPDVLSVNLSEPEGPRDYVIKTVTDAGESMRHAMTGFSWIDYLGEATLTIYPEELIVNRPKEMRFTARKGGIALENGRVELVELNISAAFRDGFGPVAQITQTVTPEQAGPVTVRLYDGSELLLEKVIQVVLPDPPAQPKGLSGTATDRAAILTWFPNSEPELEGYYLYQIRNNGWAKIGPGVIQDTRYEVAGLNDNTIYTFQVSAVDRYGRESVLSEPFQIGIGIPEDRIAPWVVGSLPASREEHVPLNTEIKLFFSENIALWEDVEEIGITAGDRPVAYEDAVTAGNVLTITLKEALPAKSHCVVILPAGWIRDSNFNVLREAYRLEFFTGADADSIAPVLAGTSPRGNAAEVPLHSQVVLYFSEAVAAGAAYNDIAVTAQGSPVPFTSVIEGNKIILTPEALPYDAAIRVNVPAGVVVDSAGNPLAGAYELLFYTVPTPDTEAPRVVSMMPSANSRGVPLNAEINIYLSEKVAAGGSFDAITLKTGDVAVEAAVTVNGNALTIRPSAGLTAGSLYRISVPAAAVQDLSGNDFAAGYEASFITGETEDHSSPALLSTNPGPGAENVSTASEIRIGFGEDIQPGGDFGDILLFASGSMLDFAAEISDGELILIPKDELPAGAKLQVVIPSGALKDVAGNSLSSQESLSFTTASGEGDGEPGDEDGESIDECFIATAAFGSKFEPSVALLRSFRDDFLLTNSLGRAFVDFYYANSPALAKFIAGNDALRAGTRLLLLPAVILVYLLYHPILLLLLIPFGYLAAGRRQRKWLVS